MTLKNIRDYIRSDNPVWEKDAVMAVMILHELHAKFNLGEWLMSYDIRLAVKVDGTDIFADIAEPELSSPTYNLREMFETCMDWDYSQGVYYPCKEVAEKVKRGIEELRKFPEKYDKFNPPNGWGSREGALRTLVSLGECIEETTKKIPIEHLYMSWGY